MMSYLTVMWDDDGDVAGGDGDDDRVKKSKNFSSIFILILFILNKYNYI